MFCYGFILISHSPNVAHLLQSLLHILWSNELLQIGAFMTWARCLLIHTWIEWPLMSIEWQPFEQRNGRGNSDKHPPESRVHQVVHQVAWPLTLWTGGWCSSKVQQCKMQRDSSKAMRVSIFLSLVIFKGCRLEGVFPECSPSIVYEHDLQILL